MKNQRGVIATVWLYGLGALALIAALAGLVKGWDAYTTHLDQRGYDRGVADTDKAYKARDNTQLQAVITKLKAAEDKAARAEADAAASEAAGLMSYQKGVQDGKAKTAARNAAVRDGTLQLRDPGSSKAGTGAACGGGIGAASPLAAGGGSDDRAAPGLSAEASGFLLSLTGDADDVARQLALAQARILNDLKVCNGP